MATEQRDHLVGCTFCGTPTANADKVCGGPSCRRLHGVPIYTPDAPAFPETPGRTIVTARGAA